MLLISLIIWRTWVHVIFNWKFTLRDVILGHLKTFNACNWSAQNYYSIHVSSLLRWVEEPCSAACGFPTKLFWGRFTLRVTKHLVDLLVVFNVINLEFLWNWLILSLPCFFFYIANLPILIVYKYQIFKHLLNNLKITMTWLINVFSKVKQIVFKTNSIVLSRGFGRFKL